METRGGGVDQERMDHTMNTLSNSKITLEVQSQGAELCSLRDTAGIEYLWQADPAIWNRHAPILFPIVGRLENDQYIHQGKPYSLPQHGFARNRNFTLLEHTDRTLVYQILPTEETLSSYPFQFELQILYRLLEEGVEVEYGVHNHGDEMMPFSIGAHPGLNLPLDEGDRIEDCFLELEKEETLYSRQISANNLLSAESILAVDHSNRIPLSSTLFDHDALIFMDLPFDRLTLGSHKNDRRVSVEFPNFPQLGIWSIPGAPYVCIEPWFGYLDPEKPYGEFCNKPDIIHLKAHDTFRCTHRILIDS